MPGLTERTLALRALRQVSALFRPQPGADSPVCSGSIRSASATQISLQHRSFRLRKSGETALQTPAVPIKAGAARTLAAGAARDGERLQRSPFPETPGRACVPVGSGASPEGPQRCALREARTFTSFRFSLSRFALRSERRDPPGIAGNESNSRETDKLLVASLIFHCVARQCGSHSVPERFTPKTGRTH